MNFKSYASEVYPDAVWTGGSSIHASRAAGVVAPMDYENKRLILKSIRDTEFIGYIARFINKTTPGVEWLMQPEDFYNLLLLDFNRVLNAMPTTETKNRLRNPSTGNYFHRVTLNEAGNIVGGVRVWVDQASYFDEEDQSYKDGIQVGFRYRLESIIPEGTDVAEHAMKVREKAQQQIIEVNEEMVELKEFIDQETSEPVKIEEYAKEVF